MDEKMKALANDILEQCQKQGLTYSQVSSLLTAMQTRCSDAVCQLRKQVEGQTVAEIKRF